MTTHYVTWTNARTLGMTHGARVTVIAATRDDDGAPYGARVTIDEPNGRQRQADVRFDPDRADMDDVSRTLGYAIDGHAPGLTMLDREQITDTVAALLGLACGVCGEELDRDCYGEQRCPECNDPCPGCYSG